MGRATRGFRLCVKSYLNMPDVCSPLATYGDAPSSLSMHCGSSWEVDLRADVDCDAPGLERCHPRYTLGWTQRGKQGLFLRRRKVVTLTRITSAPSLPPRGDDDDEKWLHSHHHTFPCATRTERDKPAGAHKIHKSRATTPDRRAWLVKLHRHQPHHRSQPHIIHGRHRSAKNHQCVHRRHRPTVPHHAHHLPASHAPTG